MISAVLFLAILGIAVWAWRTGPRASAATVPGAFARLLVLDAAGHALAELVHVPAWLAVRPLLVSLAAVAALLAWGHLAWLSAYGTRRRGAWVRILFAVLALLMALSHGPLPAIAIAALPAILSFGWRRALGTRQLLAAACGAIAVIAFGAWRFGGRAATPPLGGALLAGSQVSKAVALLLFFYMAVAAWYSLAAWVSDPSLGIRGVGRRLALSHLLVGLVPLVITAGMWLLTTWLGVGADRAVAARHAFEAEADGLHDALAQARSAAPASDGALAAVATARRAQWPHARVWALEDGRLRRVAGAAVTDERALAAWRTGSDSLPDRGVVELGGARWLGARVDGADGAVALVPIAEALAGAPSLVVGAPLAMEYTPGGSTRDSLRAAAGAARPGRAREAASDSAAIAKARRITRAFGLPDSLVKTPPRSPDGSVRGGGNIRLSSGRDTVTIAGGRQGTQATHATGMAEVRGVSWADGAWSRDGFALTARVSFRNTLAGLFRNASENAYDVIPLLILAGLALLLLPLALFNFTMVRQLGRSFLQPVTALREGTRALAEQRLEYRIPLRGDDELWDAAQAFNRMSEGLERARELEIARDRLEHELELARRIQQRLLPAGPPRIEGLEVAGASDPAREVGGDYFDHIPMGGGRVLLVIADVSGKGVPAALLMSAFRASLMSQEADGASPAQVAERLNAFLYRSVDPGKFVTAFMGFLDGATGRFVYANAGHNPPVLLRADGSVEWLATGGLILGILPECRFESGEAVLGTGDLLLLYTDGVTEGADAAGEQFGEDRLVASLRLLADRSCASVVSELVREVRAFEGTTGPADDVTLLAARRSG